MKFVITGLLACCVLSSGCATNPVTGNSDFTLTSEAEEIQQGREYHPQIVARYGVYDDPALQRYVDRVGQQLARVSHRANLEFTFTVLDSPEINAFALPGGYVYITRGIMAYLDSEAELAGVLGHEIGHVTARHSVRQQGGQVASGILSVLITAVTGSAAVGDLSQQIGTGLVRGYGRDHELEADRLGAEYLHRTGYNPENMLQVISVLKDQEIYERALAKKENREPNIYHGVFSTHPENDERLQTVVRAAKNLSSRGYRDDDREDYRAMIDGLLWGPGPRQGIVVGNRFSHPGLAFELQLPTGWDVRNNLDYLSASNPQTGAKLQIGLSELADQESTAELLRRLTDRDELEITAAAYGATALVSVGTTGGARQPARLSAIQIDGKRALTLLGTSPADAFAETDRDLVGVNRSFAHLSAAQIAAIQAPRLHIVDRGTQTFESLARESAISYDAESMLRLLNRAFPDGDIGALTRVKTVTAGSLSAP
ncbi:MAG: M48 family metalloprotease [Gammaproteobacteria bacterium]|jgi:predicted Zn-dependent protease